MVVVVVQVVLCTTVDATGAYIVVVVATAAGAARATIDTVATVMAALGTRKHGAPSQHMKIMHLWLYGMHPSGTSSTLGK